MSEPLPLVVYDALEDQVVALERDGYVFFPHMLSKEEIRTLRGSMGRLEADAAQYDRHTDPDEHGFMNKSINNVFNRDPVFLPYLDRPGVIEVTEAVLGEDAHVIGMTAWLTGPGRPEQGIHVDWQPLTLPEDIMADPRVRIPVYITTAHFYLDDIYEALGPTQFVPGSHRAGRTPQPGETMWHEIQPRSIICNAGDVVLFRSEVWHRGTANTSDRVRYLLQVHYARRIITQKFPPYLNRFQFDPKILSQATERQKRLMGDHRPSNYD